MAERMGAVIKFKPGVSQVEAVEAIKELVEKGLIDSNTKLYGYDDKYGGPVWYIP